jgi:hypothetical protein
VSPVGGALARRPSVEYPVDRDGSAGSLLISWTLPGHGDALPTCGEPGHAAHRTVEGTWHWIAHRTDCARFECPTCRGWSVREADVIRSRVLAGAALGGWKPAHFVVSPPPEEYDLTKTVQGFRSLRSHAYCVARSRGVRGGALIYHPVRFESPRWGGNGCAHPGPHFHVLGDGWLDRAAVVRGHVRDGWVVKGLGVRSSVRETALYLLSHAGKAVPVEPEWTVGVRGNPALEEPTRRRSTLETVTWFGSLSYNKFRGAKRPSQGRYCPECGETVPLTEWFVLSWVGQGPPPLGSGVVRSDAWRAWALDRTRDWRGETVEITLCRGETCRTPISEGFQMVCRRLM